MGVDRQKQACLFTASEWWLNQKLLPGFGVSVVAGLLLFEGIWMMLGFRTRTQLNALMGQPSRIMEDNTAEGDLDLKSCSRGLTGEEY